MSEHRHSSFVDGCFRCELHKDEIAGYRREGWDAFADHLSSRGLQSCGPMIAVREFTAWLRDSDNGYADILLAAPLSSSSGSVGVTE